MIVFNLLPIFPLDGYRFIEDVCILNKKILIKEIFYLWWNSYSPFCND